MFIVTLSYIRPLDEVDFFARAHGDWLEAGFAQGLFVAAGRKNPRDGEVVLARGLDLEGLQALLKLDPLVEHGVAEVEITAFVPERTAPAFADLAD